MPTRYAWIPAPALVIVVSLAATITGATSELFRQIYIALAYAAGFDARDAGPGFLIADVGGVGGAGGERLYSVGHWCTPTNLWISAAVLMAAAHPSPRRFLRAFIPYAIVVSVLITANVLLSFALHPHVPSWNWGHIPGTFVLYVGAFIWCVRWVRGVGRECTRQRTQSTAQAGDLTCTAAASPSPAHSPSRL